MPRDREVPLDDGLVAVDVDGLIKADRLPLEARFLEVSDLPVAVPEHIVHVDLELEDDEVLAWSAGVAEGRGNEQRRDELLRDEVLTRAERVRDHAVIDVDFVLARGERLEIKK